MHYCDCDWCDFNWTVWFVDFNWFCLMSSTYWISTCKMQPVIHAHAEREREGYQFLLRALFQQHLFFQIKSNKNDRRNAKYTLHVHKWKITHIFRIQTFRWCLFKQVFLCSPKKMWIGMDEVVKHLQLESVQSDADFCAKCKNLSICY